MMHKLAPEQVFLKAILFLFVSNNDLLHGFALKYRCFSILEIDSVVKCNMSKIPADFSGSRLHGQTSRRGLSS
jgi:hypothetical protein